MAKKNRYHDFDDSQVKMPELKELLSGNVKTTDVVPKKQVVEQAKEKETIKAKSVPKKKRNMYIVNYQLKHESCYIDLCIVTI